MHMAQSGTLASLTAFLISKNIHKEKHKIKRTRKDQ